MKHFLFCLCLLGSRLRFSSTQCTDQASEFQLEGDYLIGGLFDIHHVSDSVHQVRPEAINCSSQPFIVSSYRRFQMMRFAVEQINNSTNLLPNVSLGYEIFDHCSEFQNFPGIFQLISFNGSIKVLDEKHKTMFKMTKMIGVVGPFSSTETRTVTQLFMTDLIPMVSYGASSSAFSEKAKYPSFLRTVHSNEEIIEVIVSILLHFKWKWVAFLNSGDDFGVDGLTSFIKRIKDTEICLPFTKTLTDDTNHSQMFRQIDIERIDIIVVYASTLTAEDLIRSAIRVNVTNKVWIAGDTWSLNKMLPKERGIQNIGTVLGVSQSVVTIPGFSDFIHSSKSGIQCGHAKQPVLCNQVCNCDSLNAEELISMDPSFSFAVYSAVHALANALHNVLQCEAGQCNDNITLYPYMVLAQLKKSNFMLMNQTIRFDKNGNPRFGSYSIVFWNQSGDAQEIGFYDVHPSVHHFINSTKVKWHSGGEVPTSQCSPPCEVGYAKQQDAMHKCCFTCHLCRNGTYVNSTEDPYKCIDCKETEWSAEGSTSCTLRQVEYIPFTDSGAILIMFGASALVGISFTMSGLFAVNYNTPVVRSAGGPMCFLILGCLSLCSLSIFFYFGKPTVSYCILRFLPFFLFYTVCMACFVVRSFQIVCVFKMAAKFPKLHSWWMKYHGQWMVITVSFVIQALLIIIGYSTAHPMPYNETVWYPDKIILSCDFSLESCSAPVSLLLCLCFLCFIFSYMGKDLPKNYNEAKAITFCLLLLILTWIIFATGYLLYRGSYIQTLNAVAVLSSLYSFLLWYFLPKCYIIIFQPKKNTQQYFQGLIQNYTKTMSQ
ncbi:taste receptor type 1 member 1-like [Platichthys flesus]|uniref:taste receptor type 1 member 1-like n=1 Tax=Platichthys flesus TaxID=8260 RepID=UPI002DB92C31|nr:taste receptor type 1 member 1-like [Platichthys flesus]